jgi:type I restriction enzyme M protein
VDRFYTGSTGLIELSTEHVDRIAVTLLTSVEAQSELSKALRLSEDTHVSTLDAAAGALTDGRRVFGEASAQ